MLLIGLFFVYYPKKNPFFQTQSGLDKGRPGAERANLSETRGTSPKVVFAESDFKTLRRITEQQGLHVKQFCKKNQLQRINFAEFWSWQDYFQKKTLLSNGFSWSIEFYFCDSAICVIWVENPKKPSENNDDFFTKNSNTFQYILINIDPNNRPRYFCILRKALLDLQL